MIYLVLGVGLLVLLLLLARAFVAADPAKLGRIVTWFLGGLALAGVAAALVLLLLSERLLPALVAAGSLAPIGFRLWSQWRRGGGASGFAPGRVSKVETGMLSMRLDHGTGEMSGTVKRGAYAGRRLDELDQRELLALWRQCRIEDADAARLLEAYLDRAKPDWRSQAAGGPGGNGAAGGESRAQSSDAMTSDEAHAILGLSPGASKEAVKEAHRALMMKLHPDHGGSTYLAAKLNRAKEVLLGD
jgi:hypothetical protein